MRSSSSPLRGIFWGGLIAGALDLTYALTFYGLRGIPLARIPQSIASGLLGTDSFRAGLTSITLGVVLQFVIALGWAVVYWMASRKIVILRRQSVLCGLLYGVVIYCVMNYLVVPLSRAPHFKSSSLIVITGLAVHMFLIGLPIALFARRYSAE